MASVHDPSPVMPMVDPWSYGATDEPKHASQSAGQHTTGAGETVQTGLFGTPTTGGFMNSLEARNAHTAPAAINANDHNFNWLGENEGGVVGDPNDPLHMWLFQSDGNLEHHPHLMHLYSVNVSSHHTPRDPGPQGPPSRSYSDTSDRTMTIGKVPRERFTSVEKCWGQTYPSNLHDMLPVLWEEVISASSEPEYQSSPGDGHRDGPTYGLDADTRMQLEQAFHKAGARVMHSPQTSPGTNPLSKSSEDLSATFPPAEILDIALSLYFRRFHPSLPLLHIPTFSVKKTPLSLLYVICLIGLNILGTTGATDFVVRAYSGFLQHVCMEVSSCMAQTTSSHQKLATFTTAILTLNLAALTGNKDCVAQSQSLYVSLLAMAQQHGFFASNEDKSIQSLLNGLENSDRQWKAWCKVESSKRLVISLVLLDAWFSNHLSVSPILRSERVSLMAPCDELLYQARSVGEWRSLLHQGKRMHENTITMNQLNVFWEDSGNRLDSFGTLGLLSLIQVRIVDSYNRLIVGHDTLNAGVPWRRYADDPQASTLTQAVVAAAGMMKPQTKGCDVNCAVLWNSLCIMLLSDFRLFELAAGRHGYDPGIEALDDIARWSQTSSARRACVHAAQTFRLMSNRRVSDVVTIHSVSALFASALVLGLFVFMVQPTTGENTGPVIELVEIDVDWNELGDLGLADDTNVDARRPSYPNQASIRHFIQFGGTVALSGIPQHGGYEFARRALLDFANLMAGISGRKSHTFTQVLHIMGDDLTHVDVPQ